MVSELLGYQRWVPFMGALIYVRWLQHIAYIKWESALREKMMRPEVTAVNKVRTMKPTVWRWTIILALSFPAVNIKRKIQLSMGFAGT